jgi:hypothetical protein
MKKLVFVGLVALASCGSASTKEVSCDSTCVKVDSVKAVDSVKVIDSVKSK